jgi:hypothetical protein
MIVANIIMHLVEDKHLFTDEEQRELMQRLKRIETTLAQQKTQPNMQPNIQQDTPQSGT